MSPMLEIPSVSAALRRQVAADPESPFLFWPDGWNWRWWSWRQTAELAERWSAPLAGLPAACGVAFAGGSHPEAIGLDLAVQAAGLTPVPLLVGGTDGGADGGDVRERARQAAARAGCLAWMEVAGGEALVTRLDGPLAGTAASAGASAAPAGGDPGVLVTGEAHDAGEAGDAGAARDSGGLGHWRWLSQAELLLAAAEVESAIPAPSGRRADSPERQILVAGWPLQEWAGRLLAAWALAAGAALVVEADPARRLATVLWARPTVFHGTAAEVAALRVQVEAVRKPRRWQRFRRVPAPPLGRLRTLFQREPPAAEEAAFWRQRGARLLPLPGPGSAG
jgi:hypothetical protein